MESLESLETGKSCLRERVSREKVNVEFRASLRGARRPKVVTEVWAVAMGGNDDLSNVTAIAPSL